MWKCINCGYELKIKLNYPIRCECGLTDFGDRTELNDRPVLKIEVIPKVETEKPHPGQEAWTNLHSYVYSSEEEAKRFFSEWQLTIPTVGCKCRQHWNSIVSAFPPDFSSAKAFFRWGVDAHNKVNEKLTKLTVDGLPLVFSYEEACVKYGQNLCID